MENIGSQIKAIRKSLKLSQEMLARTLGVSLVTVSRWEQGKHIPNAMYFEQIKNLKS